MGAARLKYGLTGVAKALFDACQDVHSPDEVETGKAIATCPELIRALAHAKYAAVLVNLNLGHIDPERAGVIAAACKEIAGGALHDRFGVDVMQWGGTLERTST